MFHKEYFGTFMMSCTKFHMSSCNISSVIVQMES